MTSAWESAPFNRSGRSNFWPSTSAKSYRTAAHLDDSCDIDDTYSLSGRGWYAIAAQERGNWTRSVNHPCDSDAEFVTRRHDHRQDPPMDVEVVQRHRHVRAYEELTVEYGVGYWATRSMLRRCRSPNCRFATIKKRDEKRIFRMEIRSWLLSSHSDILRTGRFHFLQNIFCPFMRGRCSFWIRMGFRFRVSDPDPLWLYEVLVHV